LGPERLKSGELGINIAPVENFSVRTTWFDNRMKNPVSNVTIATNTQQRQNLGRTRIWGIQMDTEYRFSQYWRASAGYLFNNAKVTEFAANPTLVGKWLPQVPQNRGSVSIAYANPRIATLSFSVLGYGLQYNEDLNNGVVPGETEPGLPAYATVEFSALRSFGRNFDVFFGVQNAFDQEYIVQLLPTTVGNPRIVNGGIRVRWSGR
jgi:outer membrane receptor protein involved in Fe transport